MTSELSPGAVVGGYRIEGVAGRGGMGVVYRATQLALDRTVALKVLAPELAEDAAFRERFQRESKLLAAIDHPNVITVHEAGEHEGRLFIVMRYVLGTDLRALIREQGRLTPARAVDTLTEVAAALDAAHANGLIHRDVKPANVLIEERQGSERAYLSDFGLTKALGSSAAELTASGQWVGTVDYIAPEQAMGQPVDARTDVYSLGCVLYTALTGGPVFPRDSEVAKIFAHVSDPPPPLPPELGLPEELQGVTTRALAKEPDERYPSAGDFARAARAAIAGEEVQTSERTVARGEAAPTTRAKGAPLAAGHSGRRLPRILLPAAALLAALAVGVVLLAGGDSADEDSGDTSAVTAALIPSRIELGMSPYSVAVGEEGVWVGSFRDGTVARVNPRAGTLGPPIDPGPQPRVLAAGAGHVLVGLDGDHSLVRINAKTGRVVGDPIRLPLAERGEAVADGRSFWASLETGEIAQIDARSGQPLATVPEIQPGIDGPLAVGGDSLWALASDDSGTTVLRIDPRSLRLKRRVRLGREVFGEGIAFGEGAVWVADTTRNYALRIDPATGEVRRRILIETGVNSGEITTGGGAVWLLDTSGGRVNRIDPGRNRLVGRRTPVSASRTSQLAVGLGSAWLTAAPDESLIRLQYGPAK